MEAAEPGVGFQECLLHQVGRSALGPELRSEFLLSHEQQVRSAGLQHAAQRLPLATPCGGEIRFGEGWRFHGHSEW